VFKQITPRDRTTQTHTCTLHPHSSLLLLPDPVQPFAASHYTQHQRFHLPADDSASLVVLDWVTEGRSARGEHWDLASFASRNEFFIPRAGRAPRLLLRDATVLARDAAGDLRGRMAAQTVFATLAIRGPRFERLETAILAKFRGEPRIGGRDFDGRGDSECSGACSGGVAWTAARVRGFVLVKASGTQLEHVKTFFRDLLLLGGAHGGEGEVVAGFGEGALLCLQ